MLAKNWDGCHTITDSRHEYTTTTKAVRADTADHFREKITAYLGRYGAISLDGAVGAGSDLGELTGDTMTVRGVNLGASTKPSLDGCVDGLCLGNNMLLKELE
jgi:hypothetical protein